MLIEHSKSQSTPSEVRHKKSHQLIPGGAHTYAKGDDQYPERAPRFIVRGQGCHVWDDEGKEYIEYGMGLRTVTLGHAYPRVIEAAYRQMLQGNNFTRPTPIEVDCAEAMLSLVPGADMIKFAKNGSDVTTAAVRLARAYTGRDMVAVCADQPFFSVDDWFIGITPMARGVPQAVRQLTTTFRYNDLVSVEALFARYPGQIACLIMEPAKYEEPTDGFLHRVKELCHDNGAVFVLDEMITGFRWHLGGAQTYYGVEPDLSTFGKGMANGFSVSALLGKRELMELGGLEHDQERVFLLSYTHGAETHALAAALETMAVYQEEDVIGHLDRQGRRLIDGLQAMISHHHLDGYFDVIGKPCILVYVTRDEQRNSSQAFRTLFLQETLKRGLLMPSLVVSYAHTDADIDRTIEGIGEALAIYRRALDDGIGIYLEGRPVQPVFRRYNREFL